MAEIKIVLLVEDDEVDILTTKRAFNTLELKQWKLDIVNNGEEALEYLEEQIKKSNLPYFILLDLNMPKMNGIELLKEIKSMKVIKRIPVIVLTSSKMDQDRYDSYDLSVAGYLVKPVDYPKLVDTLKKVTDYWSMMELPPDVKP